MLARAAGSEGLCSSEGCFEAEQADTGSVAVTQADVTSGRVGPPFLSELSLASSGLGWARRGARASYGQRGSRLPCRQFRTVRETLAARLFSTRIVVIDASCCITGRDSGHERVISWHSGC